MLYNVSWCLSYIFIIILSVLFFKNTGLDSFIFVDFNIKAFYYCKDYKEAWGKFSGIFHSQIA